MLPTASQNLLPCKLNSASACNIREELARLERIKGYEEENARIEAAEWAEIELEDQQQDGTPDATR